MPQLKYSKDVAQKIVAFLAKKETQAAIKAAQDSEDSGSFKVVVSTDDLDRQGDVINQNGWDFSNFKNNPVVLWAHKYDELPVGMAEKIYTEGGKTIAEGKFVPGSIYPFAQTVRQMYDAGFLNTTSVGYIPTEMEGNVTTHAELLEFSFVPVPANAHALRLMVDKGLNLNELVTKGFIVKEEEKNDPEKKEPEEGDACVDDDGEEGTLEPDDEGNLVCVIPDKSAKKGAVAYSPTSKAPEDEVWDGASAKKELAKWASSDGSGDKDKMDWSKYAKGFAWFDSEKKETFGAYKLPHHTVKDGKLVVVWKGVAAAMAVLNGGRGGTKIPVSDKAKVRSHLAKHYKQFGKEVPKGMISDHLDALENETSDDRQAKYNNIDGVVKIINAMIDVYMDPKTEVEAFKDLIRESTEMMKGLVEADMTNGDDETESADDTMMKFYHHALNIKERSQVSELIKQLKKSTAALDELCKGAEPQGDGQGEPAKKKVETTMPSEMQQVENVLFYKGVLRAINNTTSKALEKLNSKK